MSPINYYSRRQWLDSNSGLQDPRAFNRSPSLNRVSFDTSSLYNKQSAAAIVDIPADIISRISSQAQIASAGPANPFNGSPLPSSSGDINIDALLYVNTPYWWHTTALSSNTNSANLIKSGLYSLVPTSSTGTNLTYGFLSSVPSNLSSQDKSGFTPFTASEKNAARAALAYISSITKLTFTEVTGSNSANINFGNNNQGNVSQGYAYIPSPTNNPKTYLFMNSAPSFAPALNNVTAGTYNWLAIFHEIGHTLGLKHPGDYDAGGGGTVGPYLPKAQDNQQYSIMSYYQGSGGGYDSSYMLYDVAALQYLYGINKSGSTAVTGAFTFNSSSTSYEKTLWSTNGTDVINLSGLNNASRVNLNAGTYSSVNIQGANNFTAGSSIGKNNVAIAYGSNINRVTLETGASITDEVILNDAYKKSQFDIIQNLTSTDKIGISTSTFGVSLNSSNVQIGTTNSSTTSAYKIIVNTATKNIYYDSDGIGGSAAVKIAQYTAIGSFSLSAANNFDFVA